MFDTGNFNTQFTGAHAAAAATPHLRHSNEFVLFYPIGLSRLTPSRALVPPADLQKPPLCVTATTQPPARERSVPRNPITLLFQKLPSCVTRISRSTPKWLGFGEPPIFLRISCPFSGRNSASPVVCSRLQEPGRRPQFVRLRTITGGRSGVGSRTYPKNVTHSEKIDVP